MKLSEKQQAGLDSVSLETSGNLRKLEGGWLFLLKWVARIWLFYQLVIAAGWIIPASMAHRALHLIFALTIIFLLYPFSKRWGAKVGILDVLLIVLTVAFSGYVFYVQQYMPELAAYRAGITYDHEIVLGILAIVIILEGTRRVLGWALPIISSFFLLYGYFSAYIPGVLGTRGYSVERIVNHIFVSGNGIWGYILGVSARDVFPFIIFASFFLFSGVGDTIMKIATGWFGGMRGGPAKAATVASGFFGMLSGAAVANIMTTGAFSIPLMKRLGYSPRFAGAVEACASTGGMFTPPFMGAAAFIMAQFLGEPYGYIVLVAIIPALLFYLSVFFAIDVQARISNLKGTPKEELPNSIDYIKRGWFNFLPLFLLIYLLVFKHFTPGRAALYGIGMMLLIYMIRNFRTIKFSKLIVPFEKGAQAAVTVSIVTACIGIVVGMIELTGLGIKLSSGLIALSGGSLPILLLLTMLASMILGLGLTPSACYITLAILVAPALVQMGIDPLAAHFFVFIYGIISMITPPVAVSAYVAASVAGADMFSTGVKAFQISLPFFIVPFMFVYDPHLLGQGEPLMIVFSVVTAIVGIWAFTRALFGWIIQKIKIWERLILIPGAILLIAPDFIYDFYGVMLVALGFLLHLWRIRRTGVKVELREMF